MLVPSGPATVTGERPSRATRPPAGEGEGSARIREPGDLPSTGGTPFAEREPAQQPTGRGHRGQRGLVPLLSQPEGGGFFSFPPSRGCRAGAAAHRGSRRLWGAPRPAGGLAGRRAGPVPRADRAQRGGEVHRAAGRCGPPARRCCSGGDPSPHTPAARWHGAWGSCHRSSPRTHGPPGHGPPAPVPGASGPPRPGGKDRRSGGPPRPHPRRPPLLRATPHGRVAGRASPARHFPGWPSGGRSRGRARRSPRLPGLGPGRRWP